MKTQPAVMKTVVQRLREKGVQATFEYPGYIAVRFGEANLSFGTANEDWGYDYASPSIMFSDDLTGVRSTCQNAMIITVAILDVLGENADDDDLSPAGYP